VSAADAGGKTEDVMFSLCFWGCEDSVDAINAEIVACGGVPTGVVPSNGDMGVTVGYNASDVPAFLAAFKATSKFASELC